MTSQTDRRNGITGNLGIKAPVRCATTANITLSGLQTIDGITVVADDRVLVKNQTDAKQNGVYNASSSTWQRALDFDGVNDVVSGTLVGITNGTTHANQIWQLVATNPITFDTTALTFVYILTTNSSTNLSALAGLTGAANKVARFTGAGAMELVDLVSATESAAGIAKLPKQITIANNATDANNDIDFLAGNFQFSDGTGIASLSALTKRLDATWAAGTNQGGLFTGSKANSTWYHCFTIYNPTSGLADCGFDTSVTAANIPSNYTKYKRVGSVQTDGSGNIIPFFQIENKFLYKTPILDANITPAVTTRVSIPISIPLGIRSFPIMNCWSTQTNPGATDRIVIFTTPDFTDITPTTSAFTFLLNAGTVELVDSTEEISNILSNTSSQIAYRSNTVAVGFRLVTIGYIDSTL